MNTLPSDNPIYRTDPNCNPEQSATFPLNAGLQSGKVVTQIELQFPFALHQLQCR